MTTTGIIIITLIITNLIAILGWWDDHTARRFWYVHYCSWILRSQELQYALQQLSARILEWHPRDTVEGTDLGDALRDGEEAVSKRLHIIP